MHSYPHWLRNGAVHEKELPWRRGSFKLQQGFRKLEELGKLNKMLKVSIATDSAHC